MRLAISERNRYAVVLAAVALGILVVGYWFRPLPKPQKHGEDVSVTRAELENLQQLLRRNSLRNLSTSFASVAEGTIAHLVTVQPWNVNAVLLPDDGLIIPKQLQIPPQRPSISFAGNTYPVRPSLWVPGVPFATARFDAAGSLTPALLSDSTPAMGGWVLVVANGVFGQTLLSPGIYNGVAPDNRCGPHIRYRLLTTVPLNQSHIGGGLFDLTGALQGLVLPCDDGPAAIPVSEVKRAIASVNSDTGALLARYGMRLAPSADGQSTVVTEVWDDWSAADAGFEPGDQVLSVDGQKVAVTAAAEAALLLDSPSEHEVEIRRASRPRTLNLVRTTVQDSAMQPALATVSNAGVSVADIAIGSSAQAAGLRDGDRILAINGRPANPTTVQNVLGQFKVADIVSVVVQRRGRRVLLVVRP